MARVPVLQIDATLGPKRWHALALCMQDPELSVRTGLATKLHAELMRPFVIEKRERKRGAPAHFLSTRRLGLSPHYMVLFALAAGEGDKAHLQTTQARLGFTVRNWRRAAQQYNDENVLVTGQPQLVAQYDGHFAHLWERYREHAHPVG